MLVVSVASVKLDKRTADRELESMFSSELLKPSEPWQGPHIVLWLQGVEC